MDEHGQRLDAHRQAALEFWRRKRLVDTGLGCGRVGGAWGSGREAGSLAAGR